jgi:precorrin-3B synthase
MRVGDNFCPGILHAVPSKDGLLIRIRVPGGLIRSSQLGVVAELSTMFSDGQVEITSRANIQLRAIKHPELAQVVEALVSVGLLPSPKHDRVRNIVASPIAGLDIKELLDIQSLVRELDDFLSGDSELAELHPKFSLALDGGGRWFSRESADLTMRALNVAGRVYFHLTIGSMPTGLGVTTDRAVDCMLETARNCLRIAKQFDIPARGRRITAAPSAISRMMDCLTDFMTPCPIPHDSIAEDEVPVGITDTKQAGLVCVIPSVPLGRLQASQAHLISAIATDWGASLRLTPWRGIVLGAIPETAVTRVIAQLDDGGLSVDGKDGYRGLSACAGSQGCEASLADVRALAVSLAHRLVDHDTKPGWRVNISGCEKQCGMRNGAMAELVANQSGYSMKLHGISAASHCTPASAIEAIVACHADYSAEAYSS